MRLWLHQAQCQDAEPELFFPASEDETLPAVAAQVAAAKAVCAGCAVWAECLSWAVTTGQAFGVWGGLTAAERRRLARSRVSDQRRDGPGGADLPPSEAA